MGEDTEKTKKIIIIAIISIIVLAVILVVVLSVMNSISASRDNMIIDGNLSKMDANILTIDETSGEVYYSIERVAALVSYEFYNGEYGQATEDRTKCYVKNNDELASFELDSNVVYKLLLDSTDRLYEKYTLTLPVKRINDKLYTTLQGIQKAFNLDAIYDAEKNVLTINTLPYLYNEYNRLVKDAGYTSLAEEFTNKKAILKGELVVLKDREIYGVLSATDLSQVIIGTKYSKIEFMENTEEFLVQFNGKYGVVTKNAVAKIDTIYDNIKVIDSYEGLYLVEETGRYGILKKDGSVLLHTEYEYIGVKDVTSFPNDNIINPYILLDSVIPVYKNGKLGFYGLDGSVILAPNRLTTLGCVSTTSKNDAYRNVLIIPESEGAEGFVVGVTEGTNATTYGIYSTRTKRLLTPTTYSRVYREVVNGQTSYYMIFAGTVSRVSDRINANVSKLGEEGSTVNVNQYITPEDEQNTNQISNTMTGNNIATGNTFGNTMTNTVNPTNSLTPSNSLGGGSMQSGQVNNGNAVVIDPNSTEPIVVQ